MENAFTIHHDQASETYKITMDFVYDKMSNGLDFLNEFSPFAITPSFKKKRFFGSVKFTAEMISKCSYTYLIDLSYYMLIEQGMEAEAWEIIRPVLEKFFQSAHTSNNKISMPPTGLNKLPGLEEKVMHPVLKIRTTLKNAIINLNDNYGWTREQIADWLETLDVDITFKTGEGESDEQD